MGAKAKQPYTPPRPPIPGRRVYAHIEAASFACPRCGLMHMVDGRRHTGARSSGYNHRTGVYTCRSGCGYRAYLGVVFWPVAGGKAARPVDHVLTPGEAAEMRLAVSYAEPRPVWTRDPDSGRRARTNVECTCGAGCAVHREGEEEGAPGVVETWGGEREPVEADPSKRIWKGSQGDD